MTTRSLGRSFLFALVVLCSSPSFGSNGFGLGLQIGSLAGLTAQTRLSEDQALDFVFGGSSSGLVLSGHWRWDGWNVTPAALSQKLSLYVSGRGGAGVGLCGAPGCPGDSSTSTRFLVLGDVGIEARLRSLPLRIFVELGPSIQVLPIGSTGLWLGLGFRFYIS